MDETQFHRQELLFGKEGQAKIEKCKVAIVGLGGLGSHVVQQLAYLGTRSFACIDGDRVSRSNLNRLVGAIPGDAETNALKVDVAARMIKLISNDAEVKKVPASFISGDGFAQLSGVDFVFGCVDSDACRLILNEYCQAYERPYLDIATDADLKDRSFGGRLIFADGRACMSCKDLIDQDAIRHELSSQGQRAEEQRIYGIRRGALGGVGPAVVSLNGIMASVAVTEFMVHVTGIRTAETYLEYKGRMAVLTRELSLPAFQCYYCRGLRGTGAAADVEHYIREGWGEKLSTGGEANRG